MDPLPSIDVPIYPRRDRLVLFLVGALVFVAAGAWMLASGWARAEPFKLAVGVVTIVFFGACAAFALMRLVKPRPLLVLDRNGFHDFGSALASGTLAWTDIEAIDLRAMGRQRMISVWPHDVEALLERLPKWKAMAARANMKLGFAPINLPGSLMSLPVEDVLAIMQTLHEAATGGARRGGSLEVADTWPKIGAMNEPESTQRARVEIWLTRTCPYCIGARRLLDERGVTYEVHDLSEHPDRRAATEAILPGHRTVPLIVIDGEPLGGFSDLERAVQSGAFDARLA